MYVFDAKPTGMVTSKRDRHRLEFAFLPDVTARERTRLPLGCLSPIFRERERERERERCVCVCACVCVCVCVLSWFQKKKAVSCQQPNVIMTCVILVLNPKLCVSFFFLTLGFILYCKSVVHVNLFDGHVAKAPTPNSFGGPERVHVHSTTQTAQILTFNMSRQLDASNKNSSSMCFTRSPRVATYWLYGFTRKNLANDFRHLS